MMLVLMALQAPLWVICFCTLCVGLRTARALIQGRLGCRRRIISGVDMGNAAAGIVFMICMDPLVVTIGKMPGVDRVMAYMDDIAATTSMQGCLWFQRTLQAFEYTGPVVCSQHRCWAADSHKGCSYRKVAHSAVGARAIHGPCCAV